MTSRLRFFNFPFVTQEIYFQNESKNEINETNFPEHEFLLHV